MAFLFKHLNISGTFVDGQPERIESLTIPYKALRECLLNSLAHRLCDSPSGFASIAIYDDRVEIENLGTLPAGFTLDDIMKPHISHAQNPLIAQVMYYGKYLETWGRGIELMNEECDLAGVPRPEFEVSGGCFKATFKRNDYVADAAVKVNDRGERGVNDLNDAETRILAIISANPSVSISEIAEALSLSRKNTHKHMAGLQKKGIIERVGPNFGGTWKINRQYGAMLPIKKTSLVTTFPINLCRPAK